jgi:hypothetical protein
MTLKEEFTEESLPADLVDEKWVDRVCPGRSAGLGSMVPA